MATENIMMECVKALQCTPENEAEDYSGVALFTMGYANELLGNLPAAASFLVKSAEKGYPLALEKLAEIRKNMEERGTV